MTAKTIRICAKCSDLCSTLILDTNDKVIAEHHGYVPEFMPEEHFGDYVDLKIDIASGKIINWTASDKSRISKFIKENRIK